MVDYKGFIIMNMNGLYCISLNGKMVGMRDTIADCMVYINRRS